MPLKISKPPKGLTTLVAKHTASAKSVAGLKPNKINEDLLPHKIYTISPQDILDGNGLDHAHLVGWRLFHPKDDAAAIESYCDERGRNHTFGGVNRGPFVAGTREALDLASTHESFDDHSYELAMLRIPSLYVMALWLKHKDAKLDILIPIAPTHHEVEPNQAYTPHEFWQRLYKAAQHRLDNHDSPRN